MFTTLRQPETLPWRTFQLLSMVAVAALLVAACGGNDDDDDGGNDVTPNAESTATTAADGDDDEGDGPGDDETVAEPGDEAELCEWVQANLLDETSFTDPDEVEESFARNIEQAEAYAASAPADIQETMQFVYEHMVATDEIYARHGYDFLAVPEEELEELDTEGALEASIELAEYCGISFAD